MIVHGKQNIDIRLVANMFAKQSVIIIALFVNALFTLEGCKCDKDWWKHAVFYQIYPRSFKDNNNDGIGDLQGIIGKLNYLRDTGVTAVWLSPIYKSPQVDHGYDISDFRSIDPEYGTLDDFVTLLNKAHDLGLKIIMDFVPNHSSNEHEWFKLSEKRAPGYEDYYVWVDANTTTGKEPNNWLSHFQDSVWEWSDVRKQYYLHQFTIGQPDLNYRNPSVVKEMKDVLGYWMDLGVDGFRMDAVPYLFEDERLLDEPLSGKENFPKNAYKYLDHIYTSDLDETYDMIYQWREFIDDYNERKGGDERIMMTEAYTSIENTMKYYGDKKTGRLGGHFTFNFFFITDLTAQSNARDIVKVVNKWNDHMPKDFTANWVFGNHDNNRVATRYGPKNVDGFNMLLTLLPGIAVTYNGEEIGQEDGEVTFEEGQDPNACKSRALFPKLSRDFERTPFQWDSTVNAGFNEGKKPWLPVSQKYHQNNLALQSANGAKSHYHVYKNLTDLRQKPAFKYGSMKIEALTDDTLALIRSHEDQYFILIFNKGGEQETVDLTKTFHLPGNKLEVVLASVDSPKNIGDLLQANSVIMKEHESIVVMSVDSASN